MAFTVFRKDPSAVLDFGFDWSSWLQTGETISLAEWTVPAGITKDDQDETTTTTVIWLSGGTADTDYDVACKITTTDGRVDERTLRIKVRNR